MASFSQKDIVDAVQRSDDAFGKRIADATSNEINIDTQYNFSPERVRLYRNSSREFPQYNTVSQFTDAVDVWTLQPDAGDTMHIESAESGTYTVNYVLQASFAFEINQSLSAGDVLRIGPRTSDDGWYLEQRGADHTDSQADVIELSGGSTSTLDSDIDLARPTTDWTRLECRYNWYGVGNQTWKQTYTYQGNQNNDLIAKTSNDGDRGPEQGNLNLWYEIEADAGTTSLELDVGSMGLVTLGATTTLNRDKPQFNQITVSGTDGVWEPIYAIRIDPDDDRVNAQFVELEILDYAANATIELVVASVDPSKTNASGWSDPGYHHADNSAIQSTTSVSEVPNASGTQTDLGSSEKFGGYTIAAAADVDGGNSAGSSATSNQGRQEKKAVLSSDELVFLARAGTTGSELSFIWDVGQNW